MPSQLCKVVCCSGISEAWLATLSLQKTQLESGQKGSVARENRHVNGTLSMRLVLVCRSLVIGQESSSLSSTPCLKLAMSIDNIVTATRLRGGHPKQDSDSDAFSSLPAGLNNCCPGIACLGLSLQVLQELVVVSENMIPCHQVQEAVVKVTHNLVLTRLAAVQQPAESRSGGKSCRLQKVAASTRLRPDTRAVVCCVKSRPFTWHELA